MKVVQQRCMLTKQRHFDDMTASHSFEELSRLQQGLQRLQAPDKQKPFDGLAKPIASSDMKQMYGKGFTMLQKMGFAGAGDGLGTQSQGVALPVDAGAGARLAGRRGGVGSVPSKQEVRKVDKLLGNKIKKALRD